ncbi:hypothetical protein ANN_04320 [Periplaneta americana]|uniref:Mos1 transposase HTH domain-containing protein n=1 Tax=Periplaneta americana TaxID=6978 RepID=A0ABQ8T9T3_PERAM|nr:hypothetical protein ANN_04320 [Periplaneta americana]
MFKNIKGRRAQSQLVFNLCLVYVRCLEQCSYITVVLHSRNARECHAELIEALGDHALSYGTVVRWVAAFQCGRVASANMLHPGCSVTVHTDVAHAMIPNDKR